MKSKLMSGLVIAGVVTCAGSLAMGQGNTPAAPQPATEPAKPAVPAATAPAAPSQPEGPVVKGEGDFKFNVEVVVQDLEVPWTIVFDPSGRMLFTERAGRVRSFKDGKLETLYEVTDLSANAGRTERGLMGLCLHPKFAENKLLYIAYTTAEGSKLRVAQLKDEGSKLVEVKEILSFERPNSPNHAGTCLKFGPDGKLYITTGEGFQGERAQKLDDLNGKILRVNDDGTVPTDNPFVGQEGARGEVWSYGHRNPQGIDWQPGTGTMFAVEHGPSGEGGTGRGGDEFNRIEKGKNYGWIVIHHGEKAAGMESPLHFWDNTVAPGGAAFCTNEKFGKLNGNLLVATLAGSGLYRIELNGKDFVSQERILTGYGRMRAVTMGPDGAIYVSTSMRDGRGGRRVEGADKILRLTPVK